MKIAMGFITSLAVWIGCRYLDLQLGSPPAIPGALIMFATTAGYSWANRTLNSRKTSATTTRLRGGPLADLRRKTMLDPPTLVWLNRTHQLIEERDMISTPELQPHIPIGEGISPIGREEFCRQIALAEKELHAFVKAVQALYGDGVVTRAADKWIALAGSSKDPLAQGLPNWRDITILASSSLAMEHFGYRPQVGQRRKESDAE